MSDGARQKVAWMPLRKRLAVIRTVRIFSKEPAPTKQHQPAPQASRVKDSQQVSQNQSLSLAPPSSAMRHFLTVDDGGVYCGGGGSDGECELAAGDGEDGGRDFGRGGGVGAANRRSLLRAGKSHSISCMTPEAQQQPPQLPKLLVSSTDEDHPSRSSPSPSRSGAHSATSPSGRRQRQATFHFPSGVCEDSDSGGNEDEADDEEREEDEEGHDGSLSRTSLTIASGGVAVSVPSGRSQRSDIQRCHSDSAETPAHALFLRHHRTSESKPQKSQDDVLDVTGGVYDGIETAACSGGGGGVRGGGQSHQPQQLPQQQPQQQHWHLHHRVRLGFGGASGGGGDESKGKTKKKSIGDKFSFLSRKSMDISSGDKPSGIKPSGDQVQRWGASFDSLLNDKYGLALFRAFLKTEYSDENIEFWVACEEYRALTGPKKQTVKAQKIYNEFVAFQAPREVNLDSTTRLATIKAMGSPDTHLFEQAQKRIQALMEKDSYQRFLRSEFYQNHVKDACKGHASNLSNASPSGH